MSHDKVINFIDTHLRNTVSEDAQVDLEDLIALHYQSIHNAKIQGYRDAERSLRLEGSPPSMAPVREAIGWEIALIFGLLVGFVFGLVVATLLLS